MDILEKYLPERWFYRTTSLYEKFGLNNYAWNKCYIIDVIKLLYEKEAIILGGDVYIVSQNGELINDGSNWYYNTLDSLTRKKNSLLSYQKAIDYLTKLKIDDYVVVPIVDSRFMPYE